jgi:hypothetical protein
MAQPASRQQLIDYAKRQLGAPVLEINVADEQIEDIVDDSLQYFYERHFDGVIQTYLKYEVTQQDIDRARASAGGVGIATTSATANIGGTPTTFNFFETNNFIQIPPQVLGINKVFSFEGSNSIASGMFSIKYQLFLNDVYYWGSTELLTYSMVKRYLEDIDFLLTTQKQIRFNQRQDRLYIDADWSAMTPGQFLVIDCYRLLDPAESPRVWNDSFLKKYVTAALKKQWGQNLIKFQGVKLPGGTELNGRQIYDDGVNELNSLMDKMSSTYELPPLDMIG